MNYLSIKWKMGILALLSAIAFIFLIASNYFVITSLTSFNNISVQATQIQSHMLMLRRHEKDFIARKDMKYLNKFESTYNTISSTINLLSQNLNNTNISIDRITSLKRILAEYKVQFEQLVKQQQVIGLHSKDGLYGALRFDVHQIELLIKHYETKQGASTQTHSLMRTMLMLRRHEKDFMLRRHLKYVDKFNKRLVIMREKLSHNIFSNKFNINANNALNNYENKFLKLVYAEQEFGLNSTSGILGEMRQVIHQSETLFNELHNKISLQIEAFVYKEKLFNILIGISLISLTMALFIFIANGVSSRISILSSFMSEASNKRDLSIRADLAGNDEITLMANVYNIMMTEFDELMTEVKHSSIELAAASQDLRQSTVDTNQGVNKQLIDSEQAATAMNQVTDSVSEVAASASDAAQASTSADKASITGHHLVKEKKIVLQNLLMKLKNRHSLLNNSAMKVIILVIC